MSERLLSRLDALAEERGIARTRLVRQTLEALVDGAPAPAAHPPSEDELLSLLAEKVRQGNVAAIRTLLIREEEQNPRERLLREFRWMAEDARSRNS